MKIMYQPWKNFKNTKELLAVFAFEQETLPSSLQHLASADGFKGKELSSLLVRPQDQKPAERVLLIGLGKKDEFTDDILRKSMSRVVRTAESLGLKQIAIRCPDYSVQTMVEGLLLASYRYDKHKTPSKEGNATVESVTLYSEEAAAIVQ